MIHAGLVMMCALVLAFAPAPQVPDRARTGAPASWAMRLPTERAGNIFFARTTIPGKSAPLWFTVDTGANLTVMDVEAARDLKLPIAEEAPSRGVGTGGESAELGRTRGVALKFGALPLFSPPSLFVLPLRAMSGAFNHPVDGVLGVDAMRGYVVEFDYAAGAITFHDPKFFVYSGVASLLPIELRQNVLVAPAALTLPDGERLDVRLLVDTGRVGRPGLNGPFVRSRKLVERFATMGQMAMARGINGVTPSWRVGKTSLQLGTVKLDNIEMDLTQATDGLSATEQYDGHIGAALLSRFRMFVDFPGRRLILELRNGASRAKND